MIIDFATAYPNAWLLIALASGLGALCLNSLLAALNLGRSAAGRSIRFAVVAVVLGAFTLPAAVPGTEQVFAPAFIVLLFETAFQAQGSPGRAISVMLIQLPLVFIATLIISLLAHWCIAKIRGSAFRAWDRPEKKAVEKAGQ